MATIIEIDYYNAFWTKKIYTGPGNAPTTGGQTYAGGSACYPGPVGFGDSVKGLGNITTFSEQDGGPVPFSLDKWPNVNSANFGVPSGPLNPCLLYTSPSPRDRG